MRNTILVFEKISVSEAKILAEHFEEVVFIKVSTTKENRLRRLKATETHNILCAKKDAKTYEKDGLNAYYFVKGKLVLRNSFFVGLGVIFVATVISYILFVMNLILAFILNNIYAWVTTGFLAGAIVYLTYKLYTKVISDEYHG